MMEARITTLIQADDDALDVYLAFILLWVAAADGGLSRPALAYLYHHHKSLPRALDRADKLLAIIADDDLSSFLRACRGVQGQLDGQDKAAFLRAAIATATAAGELSIAANHTLRFLADLLDCASEDFVALYREQAQHDLPEPGNPASLEWWRSQEARQRQEGVGFTLPQGPPANRNEALAVLGLSGAASGPSIKQAYRRLVQNHHPDRVAANDNSSREKAKQRFIQVQQAYELLRK